MIKQEDIEKVKKMIDTSTDIDKIKKGNCSEEEL